MRRHFPCRSSVITLEDVLAAIRAEKGCEQAAERREGEQTEQERAAERDRTANGSGQKPSPRSGRSVVVGAGAHDRRTSAQTAGGRSLNSADAFVGDG